MSIAKRRLLVYLALIVTVLVSANLIKNIARLWRVDDRLDNAQKELAEAREEQQELKDQSGLGDSESANEKEIRDVLKMARPNEVVVVIPEEVLGSVESHAPELSISQAKESNFRLWLKVFGF
jgi:cell division protein FtsB